MQYLSLSCPNLSLRRPKDSVCKGRESSGREKRFCIGLIMAASNKVGYGRSSLRTCGLRTSCVCHTPVSRNTALNGKASYACFILFLGKYNFAFMPMGIYVFPLTTNLHPLYQRLLPRPLVLLLRISIRSNIPTTLLPALRQLEQIRQIRRCPIISREDIVNILLITIIVQLAPPLRLAWHLFLHSGDILI